MLGIVYTYRRSYLLFDFCYLLYSDKIQFLVKSDKRIVIKMASQANKLNGIRAEIPSGDPQRESWK